MKLLAPLLCLTAVSAKDLGQKVRPSKSELRSSDCSGSPTVLANGGEFTTPNYPSQHNNHDCVNWKINRPDGIAADVQLQIKFNDFNLETNYDFFRVWIYNDASQTDKTFHNYFHGGLGPFQESLDAPFGAYMEFKSDYSVRYPGFHGEVFFGAGPPPPLPPRFPDDDECVLEDGEIIDGCNMIRLSEESCACVDEIRDWKTIKACRCDVNSSKQKWKFDGNQIKSDALSTWCWTGRPYVANGERGKFKLRQCKSDGDSRRHYQQFAWVDENGRMTYSNYQGDDTKCLYSSSRDDSGNGDLFTVRCHNEGNFNFV